MSLILAIEERLKSRLNVPGRKKQDVPGEAGVWVFILGDMSVFGIFFVFFSLYSAQDPALFQASQALLNKHYGAINTLFLLSSSLFVVAALHRFRAGATRSARRHISLAFILGLCFVVLKFVEYLEKAQAGYTLTSNDFFMFYYILTGIHFLHVSIGMVVLVLLYRIADQPSHLKKFESGAAYWHMVDLLWIVLFPLLYLIQ